MESELSSQFAIGHLLVLLENFHACSVYRHNSGDFFRSPFVGVVAGLFKMVAKVLLQPTRVYLHSKLALHSLLDLFFRCLCHISELLAVGVGLSSAEVVDRGLNEVPGVKRVVLAED